MFWRKKQKCQIHNCTEPGTLMKFPGPYAFNAEFILCKKHSVMMARTLEKESKTWLQNILRSFNKQWNAKLLVGMKE